MGLFIKSRQSIRPMPLYPVHRPVYIVITQAVGHEQRAGLFRSETYMQGNEHEQASR
jgi:hypothetical protein